jgi:hypothetical protein
MDHYLPYFRQWLISCLLSVSLPFQSLFTESLHGVHHLAPPVSSDPETCQSSTFADFGY